MENETKIGIGPACSGDLAALLEKARQGDTLAVEAIFESFKGMVRAKSRSYFLSGADGEDLIQEGMIGLYKAIRDFRSDRNTSFKVFADMCITRQIMTAVTAAARRKHLPLNTYVSLSMPAFDDENEKALVHMLHETALSDPADALVEHEQNLSFEDDLDKILSAFERSALSLYLEGAPYSEISARLHKPEKSVGNALQRVKRKLEKYLEGSRK